MFSIKKEYQISFLFLFKWLISPSSSHIRCLKWGYLLLQRINMEVGIPLVSMPYIGLLPSGPSPNCRRIYLCQCPTSGFSHFYGTPPKPTFFRYVPDPNLHMFLKKVYFSPFSSSFLVFFTFFIKPPLPNPTCIISDSPAKCKLIFI